MCLRATHARATKTGMCGRPGSSARGIGRTVQHVFLRARIEGKPRQALRGQAERACARRGLDLVQSPADLVVRKREIAEASDQPAPVEVRSGHQAALDPDSGPKSARTSPGLLHVDCGSHSNIGARRLPRRPRRTFEYAPVMIDG